jgi:hypothetical protein
MNNTQYKVDISAVKDIDCDSYENFLVYYKWTRSAYSLLITQWLFRHPYRGYLNKKLSNMSFDLYNYPQKDYEQTSPREDTIIYIALFINLGSLTYESLLDTCDSLKLTGEDRGMILSLHEYIFLRPLLDNENRLTISQKDEVHRAYQKINLDIVRALGFDSINDISNYQSNMERVPALLRSHYLIK